VRLDAILDPIRQGFHYSPRRYWNDRFRRDQTLRAAGDRRVSAAENAEAYAADWRTLEAVLPPARNVLEIGPGTGYYTARLIRYYRYLEVSCLEVSDTAAARLRGRGVEVICGDISAFKPARSWDLVLMIEVVQHIVTRRQFERAMQNLHLLLAGDLIMGALTDGRSRRTSFHVHQWTAEDVMRAGKFTGERLCDFRTGGLWRFRL
jgi:SAM-dependent methyltransferase